VAYDEGATVVTVPVAEFPIPRSAGGVVIENAPPPFTVGQGDKQM
jgi:hypothetical protein